jgi:DNA-binding beta-propeller fold protein YncE
VRHAAGTRVAALLGLAVGALPAPLGAQPPVRDYWVLVASEGVDQVSVVRFGPRAGADGGVGARVETVRRVGMNPVDPNGPHGLAVVPGGGEYLVSLAHGTPFGTLWRHDAATGRARGHVELGLFPATLQVSPDGRTAYVVNFNLHGDMVPSSVSVVDLGAAPAAGAPAPSAPQPAEPDGGMAEIARITTCAMPHGSRLTADGTRHYSACMMDEALVEIDTRALAVSRHFLLTKGSERGVSGAPAAKAKDAHAAHDSGGHGMAPAAAGDRTCSPTWAQPSPDGARVWVACNRTSDVVEIDARSWTMTRRIPMGDGVYNLAVTGDGRTLVGTNKRGRSVSVVDLATGRERARIATQRRVVHGVAISPDDRYAFVSVEGVGSEPGTVEVIDLAVGARVASADVGPMAGGIDVWKVEEAR